MRLNRTALGEFVPAMYAIPANPVMQAAANMAAAQAAAKKGVSGLGVFLPASFNVPDNPVLKGRGIVNGSANVLTTSQFAAPKTLIRPTRNAVLDAHARLKATGVSGTGMRGVHGLGAFDTSSFSNFVTSVESGSSTIAGFTMSNLLIVGVGAAALFFMSSGKRRR